MLQILTIKNLALIKEQTIEFGKGLNILLGETGSGKSLIFDSISFVVGNKSDKTLIRTGESVMRVDAYFTDLSDSTAEVMKEFDLDGDELLLTRTLQVDGKSSFKINGSPATSSMVKKISKTLLDSLVQHEGLELLKAKNHLGMLDSFGGKKVADLKAQVNESYIEKKTIEKRISALGGSPEERERTKELLSYQIEEIEKAELQIGEDEDIKSRLDLMSNAERIFENLASANRLLGEDTYSALNQVNEAISELNSLSNYEQINEAKDRLVSLRYELEDIVDSLGDIKKDTYYDEIEFNRLDRRNDQIKLLKKKYGSDIESILNYSSELKTKLDELEQSEFALDKAHRELSICEKNLQNKASELSNLRKQVAVDIQKKVISELSDLGMKNTLFEVSFKEKPVSSDGCDEVEFSFSANKGQDMKNLAKTASGGETSRIMLALKNIFTSIDGVNTLMFDEIDSGISGEIGNMVAEKLENISKSAQVLCITHLPQVASVGDNYLLVKKEVCEQQTISSATRIEGDDVIQEIARIIGGNDISEVAIKHAEELRARKKIV